MIYIPLKPSSRLYSSQTNFKKLPLGFEISVQKPEFARDSLTKYWFRFPRFSFHRGSALDKQDLIAIKYQEQKRKRIEAHGYLGEMEEFYEKSKISKSAFRDLTARNSPSKSTKGLEL